MKHPIATLIAACALSLLLGTAVGLASLITHPIEPQQTSTLGN